VLDKKRVNRPAHLRVPKRAERLFFVIFVIIVIRANNL